eukprot:120185-Chlamydomonas_euryale.AAC.1
MAGGREALAAAARNLRAAGAALCGGAGRRGARSARRQRAPARRRGGACWFSRLTQLPPSGLPLARLRVLPRALNANTTGCLARGVLCSKPCSPTLGLDCHLEVEEQPAAWLGARW